jgi:hypothetical protein
MGPSASKERSPQDDKSSGASSRLAYPHPRAERLMPDARFYANHPKCFLSTSYTDLPSA